MSLRDKLYPEIKNTLEAIKFDGWTIRYVENPTEEMKLAAIEQSSESLKFIHYPSEKLQLMVLEKNPGSILWIKNPSIKIQKMAIYFSDYDPTIMRLCPDLDQFIDEIENEMIIKDIIE